MVEILKKSKKIADVPKQSEERSLLNKIITEELEKYKERSIWKITWIRRFAVGFLAATVLITIVGIVVFTLSRIPVVVGAPEVLKTPAALIAIGSSALGAIAGLLAPLSKE